MEIRCHNCSRTFELDAARAAKVSTARCVCGSPLDLRGLQAADSGRLGKYILERRIAVGGMGEIYYAKIAGIEGFEREVAIKKLLPHLSADRDFINMMVKEAKLTVLLNHPNIVQVYDLSKEGDEYYIAMEYVPAINVGRLLEECVARELRLPVPVAVHIVCQVLRGLAYAHELRGPDGEPMHVLHRDITPQNILITKLGWVKITDFGIAKARNEISTTSPGMIKGKLGYIAPEQLSGQAPDQRVDLFCAGIVLWEMLASRRLFKGGDEIETFRLIMETKIPPLDRYRDDVPKQLESVLCKALANKREDRFTDGETFYQELQSGITPLTADDCATVTRDFLAQHPELFTSLDETRSETEITDAPTVALADGKSEPITDITELVRRPQVPTDSSTAPKGSVGRRLALAALVVLALSGAVLASDPNWRTRLGFAAPLPPLFASEVQSIVDQRRADYLACYERGADTLLDLRVLEVELVVPGTGGVSNVTFVPTPEAWGDAEGCLRDALSALAVRAHADAEVRVTAQLPSPSQVRRRDQRARAPAKPQAPAEPPKPLSQAEMQAGVVARKPAISECLKQLTGAVPGQVLVEVAVASSGRVSRVGMDPSVGDAKVEKCITRAVRGMRFRRLPSDVSFRFPLQIVNGG